VSSASVSKDWVRETTCTARSCWAHSPRGVLAESFLLAWGELVARGAQEIADLGRGGRLCARGFRLCLAGRGGVPHLGRRQRAWRYGRLPGRWWRLGVDRRWRSCCPWKGSSVAICTPARKSSPRSS